MANIGLRKPIAAKKNGNKYDKKFALGKAVNCEVKVNKAEGELYGDDDVAEKDSIFVSADITIEVTNVPIEFHSALTGHKVDETKKEVVFNKDDMTAEAGLGLIGVEKVDGVRHFVASFFPKTMFSEPDVSLNTKGDSISYGTGTISGKAYADDSGVWKVDHTTDTEAEALAWLEKQFGTTEHS